MPRHRKRHRFDPQQTISQDLGWCGLGVAACSLLLTLVVRLPGLGFACGWIALILSAISVGLMILGKGSPRLTWGALASSIIAIVVGIAVNKLTDHRVPQIAHRGTGLDVAGEAAAGGATGAGELSANAEPKRFPSDPPVRPNAEDDSDTPFDPIAELYGATAIDKADDQTVVKDLKNMRVALKTVQVPSGSGTRPCVVEATFYSRVSDELLQNLGPSLSLLPNLRAITVNDGKVTEQGLIALRDVEQLQKLALPLATDGVAEQLAQHASLREISFARRARLTDRGLQALARLDSLEQLDLGTAERPTTEVSDAGFAALGRLERLKGLSIRQFPVTEGRLAALRSLQSLTDLDLERTAVSDEDLAKFTEFPELRRLGLQATKLHGPGLRFLLLCPRLERLVLSDLTEFDGDHLKQLVAHSALREVLLMRTRLDSRAVSQLLEMRQLTRLDVSDCGLSAKTLRELRERLPNCEVLALVVAPGPFTRLIATREGALRSRAAAE